MMDQLTHMWDIISILVVAGLMLGIVAAVTVGAIRIGWSLAPWIVIFAALVWMFGG